MGNERENGRQRKERKLMGGLAGEQLSNMKTPALYETAELQV